MDRRAFVTGLGAVLAAPGGGRAQEPRTVWRVGFLGFSSNNPFVPSFVEGLRQLGYQQGKNLVIQYRWAETDYDRLPSLATDLLAQGIDVIVTPGNAATIAAAAATDSIPIVGIGLLNPVETGLVKSLAQPGGNITGVTWEIGTDPVGKKFEALRQIVPSATRIAVVWNPTLPGLEHYRVPGQTAAARLGMRLTFFEYGSAQEFDPVLDAAFRQRPDGLFVVGEPANFPRRRAICQRALNARIPTIGNDGEWTKEGCLISYAVNISDLYRRSASYVDKILKGAKAQDLPLEQPTTFNVVINRSSAKALGLTIPPSLLLRADQVIE
jgi:putative tryptophan/tyrosine transport system substrate-binding protein